MWLTAADAPLPEQRAAAKKQFDEGNYRDAWEIYRTLARDDANSGSVLADDFQMAVQCLRQLQRHHEIDGFRENIVEIHHDDWRLLQQAAQSLVNGVHYGFIVASEFHRGNQRGGGEWAESTERDRTRALQLMEQARSLAAADDDKNEVARFYENYANTLMFARSGNEAWQLQDLTDLDELPDYERGYHWQRGWGGGSAKGAPVDADGNPIFYSVPESYEVAANDGERWRWCNAMVVENNPGAADRVKSQFAQFLRSQFGVQTMQQWGIVLPRYGDGTDDDEDESGPYALHTLEENETIAKLATGVKRITLPDQFNFIRIYQDLAGSDDNSYAEAALGQLAQIFEDRQQYPKAADYWRENIERFGPGQNNYKAQRLEQIVGNWGQFESVQSQQAQTGATVEYRFRNGEKVRFTAHRLHVDKLLTDVKNYLKSAPQQLDWQNVQVDNIGYRIVQQNQDKYLGEQVAEWDLELDPRPNHFDRRVTVTTPLQQAGAYLVVGKMGDGNVSRIVLWVDDTVIAKKQLNGKAWYFVADALTGEPVEEANVEFFGWRQERVPDTKRQYRVITDNFAEFTDEQGQIIPDPKLLDSNMQWIAIARTDGGRFAHLGFSGVWYGNYHDQQYNQTKTYLITDRPVYRPSQKVQFKFWLRRTQYDRPDTSDFANQQHTVVINDPQGTEVFRQEYTTDAYGGIAGEYDLPEEPALGQYSIHLLNQGGGNFRVEEYKKPEYEVTVDAPDMAVMLGEKVTATIKANYYFGAPVTEATVKFKVHRTPHESRWYPYRRWDWLYGNGYWWFAADYEWYPGWGRWGCRAPRPVWWNWSPDPPELVLDQEVPIGPDGTVEVEIDTALAKELHGDQDHKYAITAEVVDQSRRTIVGSGNVLVAREPFRVFAWTDRGYYRVDQTIEASFQARTIDGKGVEGQGTLQLLKISYDDDGEPVENVAQEWELNTDSEGQASQKIEASESGQYRLSYTVTDAEGHSIEGGYLFVIRGDDFDGSEFRFNDLELVTDKPEYAPGETVKLMINTDRVGSSVLLFVRPSNGVYLPPELLTLEGKSTVHEIEVGTKDMPNFFVEAVTISDGELHSVVQEIIVPPAERVLDVAVEPSAEKYKPGQEATVRVKLTEANGEPYSGSVVLSMYDRSVEYISGGSNVPEIREFFWKWRRSHYPQTEHSLSRWFSNMLKQGETGMANLGVFGHLVADLADKLVEKQQSNDRRDNRARAATRSAKGAAPGAPMEAELAMDSADAGFGGGGGEGGEGLVEPTVRKQFADTAYWNGAIDTNDNGVADVTLTMPENLTGWKVRAWAMGHGSRCGEGTVEVVTFKNLLVRLQAPRFFVEKDEVVVSAIVHNYLETAKQTTVRLNAAGGTLLPLDESVEAPADGEEWGTETVVEIPAGGETRVDWRLKATAEGTASITMSALTDEESDAMQMQFPVYVHGMLKTESFSGVIRPEENNGVIDVVVPTERRPEQTRLEVRYSPTLAGAMVDALPYLVNYPYGCTEQTLNRFLPTVITQNILKRMNLDLAAIKEKRTNLNAQEIGDDAERAAQWKRYDRNPVFDETEVERMVKQGVKDLTAMQLSDGGWGWFSGWGERSYPHTTAVVVHGLQIAQENNVALVPGVMENGVAWLSRYQAEQVRQLKEGEKEKPKSPYKKQASNIDAFVYMVLVDAGETDTEMQRFLYRDRTKLSLYAQAMFGLALHEIGAEEQRDMVIENIDQFVTVDDENQTAYIDLPNRGYWWFWFGDTIEANAYYLKLLTKTNPQDPKASGLVKYLLNNRKHSTYWNSTRDTAVCIEALAEYLVASGEAEPNMLVEVWVDGERRQQVEITPEVLFTFDNSFVLEGDALESGPHKIELRRKPLVEGRESRVEGQEKDSDPDALDSRPSTLGPLYYNAYLSNFTLEDFITKAGLEIKVQRQFYKLVQREDATDTVQGARGQVIDQKALKYDRVELPNLAEVESGDLIEIELAIDSKNDYEYIVFEDMKAAGCEPVDVRSGYTAGGLGAYVEFRDEKVAFFMRTLARGKHSVSYRLRAETPGKFSALPTKAYAMYAPELKANSDEMKLRIEDGPEEVALRLRRRINVDYNRTPISEVFADLGRQLEIDVIVDTHAFKDAGLTQNMPQAYEADDVPAIDVFRHVLDQYQGLGEGNRMVLSIDEEAREVRVLTSRFAAEEGREVYPVGVE